MGADYAITMIQVGGYKPATVTDFEIPKKYGLRQTIADTLGIGRLPDYPQPYRPSLFLPWGVPWLIGISRRQTFIISLPIEKRSA